MYTVGLAKVVIWLMLSVFYSQKDQIKQLYNSNLSFKAHLFGTAYWVATSGHPLHWADDPRT
jgi:hypothetical protein